MPADPEDVDSTAVGVRAAQLRLVAPRPVGAVRDLEGERADDDAGYRRGVVELPDELGRGLAEPGSAAWNVYE